MVVVCFWPVKRPAETFNGKNISEIQSNDLILFNTAIIQQQIVQLCCSQPITLKQSKIIEIIYGSTKVMWCDDVSQCTVDTQLKTIRLGGPIQKLLFCALPHSLLFLSLSCLLAIVVFFFCIFFTFKFSYTVLLLRFFCICLIWICLRTVNTHADRQFLHRAHNIRNSMKNVSDPMNSVREQRVWVWVCRLRVWRHARLLDRLNGLSIGQMIL